MSDENGAVLLPPIPDAELRRAGRESASLLIKASVVREGEEGKTRVRVLGERRVFMDLWILEFQLS